MPQRISQVVPEVLAAGSPIVRVSQVVPEVLAAGSPRTRVSQAVVEALAAGQSRIRVSQAVLEALASGQASDRVSQVVVEVLMLNVGVRMLPVYPDHSILPGLGYNVKWLPQAYNMPTQKAVSGARVDLALSQYPTHTFQLTYEFLRDGCLQNHASSEFRTLMGFFLRIGGVAGRFLFRNPDDNRVVAQNIGTTDGVTVQYLITRTFGVGANSGTEPIGYLDQEQPVNVYLNGVLQTPGTTGNTYQFITSQPGAMYLKFNTTPTTGQVITMDHSYYYYCGFPADTYTFEKFMDRLWLVNQIDIETIKAGG